MSTIVPDRSNRLYVLRPNVNQELYCGRTFDGRQFLLGPKDASTLCIVLFDNEGNYLEWQEQIVSPGALFGLPPPGSSLSHEEWTNAVRQHYERIISDIGGHLEPIRVHSFSVPDANFDMSISELPSYLQPLVDSPEEEKRQVGEAEFERLMGLLAEWIERGDYVLNWGGGFHVSRDGEIVFS